VKAATPKQDSNSIHLKAPAKINLFLKVLARRQDGYHEVESLMVKVALYDHLQLTGTGQGIKLSCSGGGVPDDRSNLVYRAAEAFFAAAGIQAGVEINLEKNIPVAAGLGGGSSDAAAAIAGLNELFDAGMGQEQLMDIARPLGADVPFFVQGTSAALATGIGDCLQQVEPLPGHSIVLVNPGFGVSTEWVYQNFPLTSNPNPFILARGQNGAGDLHTADPDFFEQLGNDLEAVTIKRYPEIGAIKSELKDAGASVSLMSGSGPTVFGLFVREKDAQSCFRQMSKKYGGNVFLTGPHIP
jgi:4-diphosphocytidyl-2-C-methyl-D-erythritol kinase